MQCNTTGEICGMCTRGTSDNDVIANQVLLGLDEDNKIADGS